MTAGWIHFDYPWMEPMHVPDTWETFFILKLRQLEDSRECVRVLNGIKDHNRAAHTLIAHAESDIRGWEHEVGRQVESRLRSTVERVDPNLCYCLECFRARQ